MTKRETTPWQADLSWLEKRDKNNVQLLMVMIVIFLLMTFLNPNLFFTRGNFEAIAFSFPQFAILALAVMVTMLSGGIDLSVVGTSNLAAIAAALILTKGIPHGAGTAEVMAYLVLAVVAALVTGIVCGMINGLLISKFRIPEILATLGTMQVFTGIAIVLTKGHAIFGFPEQLLVIGNDSLAWIPIPLILFFVIVAVIAIILNKTAFGFELYLLGANRTASRFTGIKNQWILMKTYMLSGALASIAGIVIISQTNSAKADFGTSYLLQTIVVAVMGGINPNGGFGKLFGVVVAIITMQFLSSGFNMMRLGGSASNYVQEIAWGIVLLLVMMIKFWTKKKGVART
jgi:simple sugar transport system permease protein